ncbi:hypothetical protein BH23ACT6_BH23ACT6_07910 [soil metagenome]
MGFLDKAKAAANDLAAKADTAITQATAGGGQGETDRYVHDLGVLAYAEHSGQSVDHEARGRALAGLDEMRNQGRLGTMSLSEAPPPAPGTAGSNPTGPPPPPGAPPNHPRTPPPPPPPRSGM